MKSFFKKVGNTALLIIFAPLLLILWIIEKTTGWSPLNWH